MGTLRLSPYSRPNESQRCWYRLWQSTKCKCQRRSSKTWPRILHWYPCLELHRRFHHPRHYQWYPWTSSCRVDLKLLAKKGPFWGAVTDLPARYDSQSPAQNRITRTLAQEVKLQNIIDHTMARWENPISMKNIIFSSTYWCNVRRIFRLFHQMQKTISSIQSKNRSIQAHDKHPSAALVSGIVQKELKNKIRVLFRRERQKADCPGQSSANGEDSTKDIHEGQMSREEVLEIWSKQKKRVYKPGQPRWPEEVGMCHLDETADDAGWIETAAGTNRNLTKQNSPSDNIREERSQLSGCQRLGVVLLTSGRWPNGTKFGDRRHQDRLADCHYQSKRQICQNIQ